MLCEQPVCQCLSVTTPPLCFRFEFGKAKSLEDRLASGCRCAHVHGAHGPRPAQKDRARRTATGGGDLFLFTHLTVEVCVFVCLFMAAERKQESEVLGHSRMSQ